MIASAHRASVTRDIANMPLHRFYVPPGLYTAEDKAKLSEAITAVYASIPRFYVVVVFIEVDKDSYYVGGKPTDNFVRVVIHHLARQFPKYVTISAKEIRHLQRLRSDQRKKQFMDTYEKAIEPFTKERGVDWEVEISDEDVRII